MSTPSSSASPGLATPAQQGVSFFGGNNGAISFSVKTTLIYIGGSLGVLAFVIAVMMIVLVLCVRPTRRRRELYLATQRQRETGVQQVKVEVDTFKPQLRSFPIVILQPNSSEIACGQKVGLDEEVNYHPTLSFTSMEDIETGGITTAVQDPSGSRGSMRPTEYGASVAALSNSSASHSAPGFVPTDGVIDPAGAPQPGHSSTADATAESPPTYNPLTHYMTERQPHLFVVEVER